MFKIFLISLLFTLNVLGQVSGQEKKNYLLNGDFEIGKTGWTKTGSMNLNILTGTNALDGKQSLEVSDSAFQTSTVYQNFLVNDNLANKTCSLSFIAKNTSVTTTGSVTVKIRTGATVGAMSDLANASVVVPVGTSKETYTISGFICPQKGYYVGVMVTVVGGTDNFNPTVAVLDNFRVDLTNFNEVSNVTSWSAPVAITVGAVTTAPTKATTPVADQVTYRQVGENYQVKYQYKQISTTGSANGSGDFLFTLPGPVKFPTTTNFYTGSGYYDAAGIIPTVSYFSYSTNLWGRVTVVPYDQTRFRLQYNTENASSNAAGYLSSTSHSWALQFEINIEFSFKGAGLSNSATVINAECPNGVECEKTLSATVTSGGVVDETDYDWINGSVTFSSGTATINLNSIGITQAMKCGAAINEPGATAGIRVESVSTSQIVVKTYNLSAVGTNVGFKLDCTKAKVDFKGKRVIQADISNTVKSDTGRRLESISYRGATTGTNCTSSPCGYDSKTSGISTLVRDASGNYTVNFSPACTEMPSCSVMATNGSNTIVTYRNGSMAPTLTTYSFGTAVPGGSISDTRGDIICTCK